MHNYSFEKKNKNKTDKQNHKQTDGQSFQSLEQSESEMKLKGVTG